MQQAAELIALRGSCCDVLSACAFLRAQWPFSHFAPTMPPMMLLFQLYFLLPDRTAVDRQIASLQSQSKIRVIKLFASDEGHDLAIVLQDDYEAAIRAQMPTAPPQDQVVASAATKPATISRPASLPVGSSSSASAASASPAAPVKSRSSIVPAASSSSSAAAAATAAPASVPTFAPWPSSRSSAAAPAAGSSPLSPKPPQPAKPEVRRKRSQPISGTAAAASSAAASSAIVSPVARSASVGSATAASSDAAAAALPAAAAAQKRSKVSHSSSPPAPAAAASSSSDASAPVSSAGGVHSKLHVNLSDTLTDERFPALASSHPSHFIPADATMLLRLFLQHVVTTVRDVSITLEQLIALVYSPHVHRFQSMTREQSVSCLLHMQVLLFKSATSFYFSVPGIGRLLSALRLGRKEVLSLLRKRTYKELPLRDLLALPALKSSPCRVEFHLREMLGSEHLIHMESTTIGPLIKIRQPSS